MWVDRGRGLENGLLKLEETERYLREPESVYLFPKTLVDQGEFVEERMGGEQRREFLVLRLEVESENRRV